MLVTSPTHDHNERHDGYHTELTWPYPGSLIVWAFYRPFKSQEASCSREGFKMLKLIDIMAANPEGSTLLIPNFFICLPSPSQVFQMDISQKFSHENSVWIVFSILATRPVSHSLLDFIIPTMLDDLYLSYLIALHIHNSYCVLSTMHMFESW